MLSSRSIGLIHPYLVIELGFIYDLLRENREKFVALDDRGTHPKIALTLTCL